MSATASLKEDLILEVGGIFSRLILSNQRLKDQTDLVSFFIQHESDFVLKSNGQLQHLSLGQVTLLFVLYIDIVHHLLATESFAELQRLIQDDHAKGNLIINQFRFKGFGPDFTFNVKLLIY